MDILSRISAALFFGLLALSPAYAQKKILYTADEPLPPADAAASMRVPDGFCVTLFAGEPDVMQPIGFCIDDRARLWVAEAYNYPNHGTKPGDRVVILEDTDGDGCHDKRTVFCDNLNYVTGIEVGFGGVWVMSPPNMYFLPDRNGDDIPDGAPEVVLDGFGNHANAHNLANGFAWGPDGWLYATHGRSNWSMIGKPGDDDSKRRRFDGGVWRYDPVRDVWEPYADGTTNPWGIDWNDHGDGFVCNCVNPHLFHVIQGAHYEPWRGRESSRHAYQRIDTIADHLHFVGLGNVRDGLGSDAEDSAGGGHAHCGTMVYLGDNFPKNYRNQLFTNNLHGRRINNDLLRPSGSGYVASHGPDLMRSADPWYMGITLAYGPGGEVYVSDWSDTGECHSTRNTRRHTGRIYRITYLKTKLDRVALADKSNGELVSLQLHDNDWFVRHARRLLHERSAAGADMSEAHQELRQILNSARPVAKRLRGLWALWVSGGISDEQLIVLLDDVQEPIRRWAVTLLCQDRQPPVRALQRMRTLAGGGKSPRVRLAIASALQRLSPEDRWPLAKALASRGEDSQDQNLPLMVWYGIEPLIDNDLELYAQLACSAAIPRVRENMARRIASSRNAAEGLELLAKNVAGAADLSMQTDVLSGMLLGLEGLRHVPMPKTWPGAYARIHEQGDTATRRNAIRLALIFRDQDAIKSLRKLALDSRGEAEHRSSAIDALVDSKIDRFGDSLLRLLDDADVRRSVLRGLSWYNAPNTAGQIVARYGAFSSEERQLALQTLSTRVAWGRVVMEAMRQNKIPAGDVTALTARQLQSLGDESISAQLKETWGEVRSTEKTRAKQIASLEKTLTQDVIAKADMARGAALYKQHCANCHRFFGEGGKIGPDITGAQRNNVRYLLDNIVDPSASVSQDYRMQVIVTEDGQVISGLVEDESERTVTVVNTTDRIIISRNEIESQTQSAVSIMPTGLLERLNDREIRDLIGYLQR